MIPDWAEPPRRYSPEVAPNGTHRALPNPSPPPAKSSKYTRRPIWRAFAPHVLRGLPAEINRRSYLLSDTVPVKAKAEQLAAAGLRYMLECPSTRALGTLDARLVEREVAANAYGRVLALRVSAPVSDTLR